MCMCLPYDPVKNPNKLIGSPSCTGMELSLVCLGQKDISLCLPGKPQTVFVFFLDVNALGSKLRAHSSMGVGR